ncbi:mechanosensitive ion channel [Algoriphagus halophytocola]|uniref:Mechanosensitive ion channel n=1 Tax=Algoriphagus halophytocola TaxID=2991499 RepID=A0ABY6ML32_9BACT|nr:MULTISPECIES: mechanosensitive ion channel domain-containing protein [unclassified Algoriphagus]UZD24477.1 mechanosensitive ion channel [Algoriphagus sp. TR-M5]WBL41841.1 mechanosensitive ion channel [Algoriphagus sp. TR-M9]
MISRLILVLLIFSMTCNFLLAQDTINNASIDSIAQDSSRSLISKIESIDSLFIIPDSLESVPSRKTTDIGKVFSEIINRAQLNAIALNQIKMELSEPLDTLEMSDKLPSIRAFANTLKEKSTAAEGQHNLRYLQGMENLIDIVSDINSQFAEDVKDRIEVLTDVGERLVQIKTDTVFNLSLRDTTLIPAINHELNLLRQSIHTIDSSFLAQEIIVARFQAKISSNTVTFLELQQLINSERKQLEHKIWTKEIGYPWEPSHFDDTTTFNQVIKDSILLNSGLLLIYIQRFPIIFSLAIFLTFGLYLIFKRVLKKISDEKEFANLILQRVEYFDKHTFWSTLICLLPFFLISFNSPPLVFVSILSLLLVIGSTFLVKNQFGKTFHRYWVLFLVPYILLAYSGLHWKIAYQERWYIMFSSIIFILMGYLVWKDVKDKEFAGAGLLKLVALFMILLEVFGLAANILGRFNLAKIYTVTGVVSFYRAVGLYLFVQACLEAVYLLIEYSKKENDGFTSYFDFQDLQKRMKGGLSIVATIFWIYGVLWNLGYFDQLFSSMVDFLSKTRVLGDTEFEFGSILLFLFILYISTFLANNIAYFASIKDQKNAHSRKQRLGSSVLLIRLAVLIVGFFIGMTAAKIPFDKIAIVLGALSVGIGFGLQTIINNLVSGIILAFERPIQIGDEIQVGQNSGTVKDVGIRASKIRAYDGSEIIVPNGDLLSQSLINWTLSDKKRRVELIIGVGYGSDMKLVKSILENILQESDVLKVPNPRVYMQTFNDNSVDFRVLFWVENMDVWLDCRSTVMTAIFEKFAENGIEIPFPKRDLYIKSLPGNWKETISKPNEEISPDDSEPKE